MYLRALACVLAPCIAALSNHAAGVTSPARAALAADAVPAPAGSPASGAPGTGTLLLRMPSREEMLRAPAVDTDVRIRVTGLVARTRVVQRFTNPSAEWVEGVYVFPLPERSAVDRLRLHVGERRIEGRIRERAQAKRIYSAAKRDGRRASLVEQERPNVFTTSVANLDPHGEVTVEIEYQQRLRYDAGRFSLRFPMVVGPRYVPGEPLRTEQGGPRFSGTGVAADTGAVGDASRITPPVLPPAAGRENPVTIRVELAPGFALAQLDSPSHAITARRHASGHTEVLLSGAPVPAERDFVLEWRPAVGHAPRAALFTERHAGADYALLMVLPPQPTMVPGAALRREIVYVIDVSGSMGGASIRQARAALDLALSRLGGGDRFNVIAFNDRVFRLHDAARTADAHARAHARRWVAGLRAGGGTEMLPALAAALAGARQPGHLRQVVFITDGAVGNEDALFALIARELGASRLFTVGIGSAPNAHLLRRASELGRGSHTFIATAGEVAARMGELFAKLEHPVMRDLAIAWPGAAGEVQAWPPRLPDLYAGEPLVVTARLAQAAGEVRVEGTRAVERWRTRLALQAGGGELGIHALWARERLAALESDRARGADPEAIRRAGTRIALAHGLVSRWTSLVAVDVTAARAAGEAAATRAVPTRLPAGWDYAQVFGALPATATPAALHAAVGLMLMALAAVAAVRRRRGARSC